MNALRVLHRCCVIYSSSAGKCLRGIVGKHRIPAVVDSSLCIIELYLRIG